VSVSQGSSGSESGFGMSTLSNRYRQ
jgi:hypothetical protein